MSGPVGERTMSDSGCTELEAITEIQAPTTKLSSSAASVRHVICLSDSPRRVDMGAS